MSPYVIAGSVGALLIVVSYLMLMSGRLSSDALGYCAANGLGAALLIVSLLVDFNLPAMLIQVFWLAISLYGVSRALAAKRSTARIRANG
jgi:hypothetical protein